MAVIVLYTLGDGYSSMDPPSAAGGPYTVRQTRVDGPDGEGDTTVTIELEPIRS